jgi:hypothetical protein
MESLVDRPNHYCAEGLMVADLCEIWKLDHYHQLCSAIEYIFRCNKKGSKILDLEKSSWWIKRYLDKRFQDPYKPLNFSKINKDFHPAIACRKYELEKELSTVVCLIVVNGKSKEALSLLNSYIEALKQSHSS